MRTLARIIGLIVVLVVGSCVARAQELCIPTYCPGGPGYEAPQAAQEARAQVIRPQARQHRLRAEQRMPVRRAQAVAPYRRAAAPKPPIQAQIVPRPVAATANLAAASADQLLADPGPIEPASSVRVIEGLPVFRVQTVVYRSDEAEAPRPQPETTGAAFSALYMPPEPPVGSANEFAAVFIAGAFVISGLFITLRSMPPQSRERPRFPQPNFGAIHERFIATARTARAALARQYAERRMRSRQSDGESSSAGMPDGSLQCAPVWLGQAKRQNTSPAHTHNHAARQLADDPFDGGAPLAAVRRRLRATA